MTQRTLGLAFAAIVFLAFAAAFFATPTLAQSPTASDSDKEDEGETRDFHCFGFTSECIEIVGLPSSVDKGSGAVDFEALASGLTAGTNYTAQASITSTHCTGERPHSATVTSTSPSASFTVGVCHTNPVGTVAVTVSLILNGSTLSTWVDRMEVAGDPNVPPTIMGPASVQYAEGRTDKVTTYTATDPDSSNVVFWVSGTDAGRFRLNGSFMADLTFRNTPDYENPEDSDGDNVYQIMVNATDSGPPQETTTLAVTITVTNVNERPQVDVTIPSQTLMVADGASIISLLGRFSDPDEDPLNFDASSNNTGVASGSVSGSTLTVTPHGTGTATITLTAYDRLAGDPERLSMSQSFTVTVRNSPPTVEQQINKRTLNADVDVLIELPDKFSDPDGGDILSYSADSSVPSVADAGVSGTQLTVSTHKAGTTRITVTAYDRLAGDPERLSVSQSFAVTVNNRPPMLDGPTNVEHPENDETVVATYMATDDDDHNVTFSLEGKDGSGFTLNNGLGDVDLLFRRPLPDYEDPMNFDSDNAYEVTVLATDDGTPRLTRALAVTIRVTNVDEPGTVEFSTTTPQVGMAITASLTDPDLHPTNQSWQWQRPAGGTTWDNIANATSSSYMPDDDDRGSRLRATVSYRDGHGPGKSAASITAMAVPTTVPSKMDAPTLTPGDGSLTVEWLEPYDGGAAISSYFVQYSTAGGSSWTSIGPRREPELTTRTTTISGLTNGTTYEVQVKACNPGCQEKWSDSATGTPVRKLAAPENLVITPLPLRKALLTWTGDRNAIDDANLADDHIVRVRKVGEADWEFPNLREQSGTSAIVLLDTIWEKASVKNGMADLMPGESYEYRIRSVYDSDSMDASDPYADSGFSDPIRIIDNPLLAGGGKAYGSGDQEAFLQWKRIADATEYFVEYRVLTKHRFIPGDAAFLPRWHWNTSWPDYPNWPYYQTEAGPLDSPVAFQPLRVGQTVVGFPPTRTINLPDLHFRGPFGPPEGETLPETHLYAFRVSYVTTTDDKVYSARDAYVWPSDDLPRVGDRVATYPFFGYWEGGRYEYTVCSNTFDNPDTTVDESAEWPPLINHAFGQWESALPGKLDVVPVTEGCTDIQAPILSPVALTQAIYNDHNEVYMVDTSLWDQILDLPADFKLPFGCVLETRACVMSPRYFSNLLNRDVRALNPGSVDILVGVGRNNWSQEIPHSAIGDDVRFNTCLPKSSNQNLDIGFLNYRLMVHEVGHALGISGFSLNLFSQYPAAHATIPDTVMNYDNEVSRHLVPGDFQEPDCSPHPFDIMAMQVLYR